MTSMSVGQGKLTFELTGCMVQAHARGQGAVVGQGTGEQDVVGHSLVQHGAAGTGQ